MTVAPRAFFENIKAVGWESVSVFHLFNSVSMLPYLTNEDGNRYRFSHPTTGSTFSLNQAYDFFIKKLRLKKLYLLHLYTSVRL